MEILNSFLFFPTNVDGGKDSPLSRQLTLAGNTNSVPRAAAQSQFSSSIYNYAVWRLLYEFVSLRLSPIYMRYSIWDSFSLPLSYSVPPCLLAVMFSPQTLSSDLWARKLSTSFISLCGTSWDLPLT